MIKLTNSPELNYGENQITVVGAFEQDGRLYDIVVEAEGDLLKKGGQVPDLARRIQGAWQVAYREVLLAPGQKKLAPEKVSFTYRPDQKIARVVASELSRFSGLKSGAISETMESLYRDVGIRVMETRLHEPPPRAAEPPKELQAACEPLFAKHAKNPKHLFFNRTISDVKNGPLLQKRIGRALKGRKGDDFNQIQAFIREIEEQLPPKQKAQREQFARRLFAELFLSEANRALFLSAK